MRRFCLSLFVVLIANGLVSAWPVRAQESVDAPALFVKSRLGFTQYTGENSPAVLGAQCTGVACSTSAYGLAVELGLQWSSTVGMSVAYQSASYPSVAAFDGVPAYYARNYRVRETIQLLAHYRFAHLMPRLTPYLQAGAHVTTGRTPLPEALPLANGQMRVVERWAFGPSFGAGVDIAVSRRLAVFAEVATNVTFPDDALDGQGGFLGADRLSWVGIGLRLSTTALPQRLLASTESAAPPPAATAPMTLTVGEIGRFAVDEDDAASRFRWTFSDGSAREGATVTKQFATPGTYQAAVHTADDDEPLHTFQVRVRSAAPPPHIGAIQTTPDAPQPGQAITFEPDLRSGTPVEYRWNFGDGTIAFTRAPTYTYPMPDTYEVTLRVISPAGRATHTRSIVVGHRTERDAAAPYVVQLGAFSSAERAERFARRHAADLPKPPRIQHDAQTKYHRVSITYADEAAATTALQQLRQSAVFADAFLYRRSSASGASAPSVAGRHDAR